MLKEALYYEPLAQNSVLCKLCPKTCAITEGGNGFCQTRQNIDGKLYALNYARSTSQGLDQIEKKPLYHFYPGSVILSLGTWGCNFACRFCQNHGISKGRPDALDLMPELAVKLALDTVPRKNIGLAYTYSEPGVWFEYILETAKLIRQAGLKNVLVTNGFINREPLRELLPYIDAMNIDVKAFNDNFYREICSGSLNEVLKTVEETAKACHVEITTLIVPGLNDSQEELTELASWLKSVDENIPLHFSRYFPRYKLDVPPTPPETLNQALKTAQKYLNYVYVGNMPGDGVNTYCPSCSFLVINRLKFESYLTTDNRCPNCQALINIAGQVRM